MKDRFSSLPKNPKPTQFLAMNLIHAWSVRLPFLQITSSSVREFPLWVSLHCRCTLKCVSRPVTNVFSLHKIFLHDKRTATPYFFTILTYSYQSSFTKNPRPASGISTKRFWVVYDQETQKPKETTEVSLSFFLAICATQRSLNFFHSISRTETDYSLLFKSSFASCNDVPLIILLPPQFFYASYRHNIMKFYIIQKSFTML